MQAPNHRYYAFVSKFVEAVTTDALTNELIRLRGIRLDAAKVRPLPAAAAEDREAA